MPLVRFLNSFLFIFITFLSGFLIGCQAAEDARFKNVNLAEIGLDAIQKRGTLRIATRNNSSSYFVWRGQPMGFQFELANRFAKHLGVKLEIVAPEKWGDLFSFIERGKADLIAETLTITPKRSKRILFSNPYSHTQIHIIWKKGFKKIEALEDLAGKNIHVREHSSYAERLNEINRDFKNKNRPLIKIIIEPEEKETEIIFAEIVTGKIPYTIADENLALVNKTYLPDLVIGPAISAKQDIAWAVHPKAENLVLKINEFFQIMKKEPTYNILYRRYYKSPHTHAKRKDSLLFSLETGQISPYDGLIKSAAKKYDFDWRLLAAQIYQESKFNPNAKSWAGARGLYQIMPNTAKELGIKDPEDPVQSIHGGAKYLKKMHDRLNEIDDETQRLKIALAAYNCGWGHIMDALKIAKSDSHFDEKTWEGIGKALTLLSQKEYARKAKFGYVRASEPIKYVKNIWDYYQAYRHVTGERE